MSARLDAGFAPAAPRSSALPALMLLGVTILSAAAMRTVFSPVQDLAKAELQLSDFQLSLVQGLAAALPVALLSIPIGRMTDRGNRMRLLTALAALWTLGTIGTAFATEFYSLFVARMFAGLGAMCAIPVAISLAADLSAPEQRGRSLLILSIGNTAGAAAAFALTGVVLTAARAMPDLALGLAPWRVVHIGFGLASLALLLPLLAMREPGRREMGEAVHTALKPALAAIWKRRALLAPLFLGQVTVVMADTAAGIWAAPVLSRSYGLAPEDFAGWMGLVILASAIIGSVIGGLAADAGHKSKIKGGILLGAVVAAALSIPGALFPVMPSTTTFALSLTLFLTCGAITGLVTSTAIAVLVPNEIRGVCLGAFIVLGAIVGLGIAPTLVTMISDSLGGGGAIRYGLAITGAATSIIAALGFGAAFLSQQRAD
ncbi:MAG: MFS transporter [Hyphomonadaceae bacterium]